jgi:ribosome-associated toxin RatA of RatAB toxin-antitoxin module
MKQVKRSALVGVTAQRMFELINDVESYPQFVPGCAAARVISRGEGEVVAALDIRKGLLRTSFTTRNTLRDGDSVHMALVEGPFRSLTGVWKLLPICAPSGEPLGCRVELEVNFELSAAIPGSWLGPLFEQTVAGLVDAFVVRSRLPA